MLMALRKRVFTAMLFFVLGTVQTYQDLNNPTEFHVKAAYLFLFGKYITWPADTTPVFTIGVYGPDPFGPIMEEVLEGKYIRNKPVAIKRFGNNDPVEGCQVLYISKDISLEYELLEAWHREGILTVGENSRFLEKGGAIKYILKRNRIQFSINLKTLEQLQLKPSSQLLKIAHKVVR